MAMEAHREADVFSKMSEVGKGARAEKGCIDPTVGGATSKALR